MPSPSDHLARATHAALARRVRGLSDRAIAWLFIAPTMVLLLAINIFPLIWTIGLSFTNYRANRPNAPVVNVGIDHYVSILTDPDVWHAMQATAHFLFWTILLQTLIGFALAWLIDRKFRGHGFWTTVILIPMMLSPAVVGNWAAEAARFVPGVRVLVHHGANRASTEELVAEASAADILLTTYATAVRDVEALAAVSWDALVLDEAQLIKNATTDTASASIPAIRRQDRMASSGSERS